MSQPIADFPDTQVEGHDLDPNVDGDLVVGPLEVPRLAAVIIAAKSEQSEAFSVSVDWTDKADDVTYRSQSATDINLSGVTDDGARLYRKGSAVKVTLSSDSGGGTTNVVNVHVGAER
jgi:hypothetical protein